VERLVTKFVPMFGLFYNDMDQAFPDFKYMFSARHPRTCINSWFKLTSGNFEGVANLESSIRYAFDSAENELQDLPDELIVKKGRLPL